MQLTLHWRRLLMVPCLVLLLLLLLLLPCGLLRLLLPSDLLLLLRRQGRALPGRLRLHHLPPRRGAAVGDRLLARVGQRGGAGNRPQRQLQRAACQHVLQQRRAGHGGVWPRRHAAKRVQQPHHLRRGPKQVGLARPPRVGGGRRGRARRPA
ncbi:MAG: hypothetical protein J3K34DRAFT_408333 [Monoraphidium minutum]|nr:MAG: hypothetical protein J3K34DRAFT_408333 [Monoraphidium minutum]